MSPIIIMHPGEEVDFVSDTCVHHFWLQLWK